MAAEAEFTARGVRIDKRRRSLTRAGQVRITDGRLELLTSYGSEIDSAPVATVRAGTSWFASGERAHAEVNGTRYVLTMEGGEPSPHPAESAVPAPEGTAPAAGSTARRFVEAVRRAGSRHEGSAKGRDLPPSW
ncbi:hypothetical protein [Streptomyces sp. NPDC049906]|jgi:hypothetical protein|uniref:hypothetical protein n=1 Tax=Streptomyces sp. NPDC049906 TaxID=3155656 RepID=UPI0034356F38